MAENTKIEWTDHTFNPWEGCQKVGPGCDHCYAETRNARFAGGTAINWGPGAPRRRTSASNWALPKRWNAQSDTFMAQHGRRQRVFCASLADVFDNAVPVPWRQDLFDLIRRCENLDFLLLTKRVGNVRGMLANLAHGNDPDLSLLDMMPPPNVWIGATIVNQAEADRDIPKLLAVPAAKRFLSIEPLLGPVDINYVRQRIQAQRSQLARAINGETWLDWVIVGGESGPNARPMHPDWARSIHDQCAAAGVPFLFKQWGEWRPMTHADLTTLPASTPMGALKLSGEFLRPFCENDAPFARMVRIGKKAAGRLLDGRTHDGFPAIQDAKEPNDG